MDRQAPGRKVPTRPRQLAQNKSGINPRRRTRVATRRNRRLVPKRNRLERAQNNQNRHGGMRNNRRFRPFNNLNRRRNFQRRTIYVGGLPTRINNRQLLQLFRIEGRIISYKVIKNREGYSRGYGFVEFARPRDAWRSIQKWNNSLLDRNIIKVRFGRRRNVNRRYMNNNNRNNGRFNQARRDFGFRERGRGGFRQRANY